MKLEFICLSLKGTSHVKYPSIGATYGVGENMLIYSFVLAKKKDQIQPPRDNQCKTEGT